MEQFTELVEGQNDGQETAATLGGLQVSDYADCSIIEAHPLSYGRLAFPMV